MGLSREDAIRSGLAKLLPPDDPFHVPDGEPANAKRNKFRAQSTVYNGRKYPSKAEANRAEALDWEQEQGFIRFWLPQVKIPLGPDESFRVDFLVIGLDGVWAEDPKGIETSRFRTIRRLWAKYGPCPLKIIKRGKVAEVIDPKLGTIRND